MRIFLVLALFMVSCGNDSDTTSDEAASLMGEQHVADGIYLLVGAYGQSTTGENSTYAVSGNLTKTVEWKNNGVYKVTIEGVTTIGDDTADYSDSSIGEYTMDTNGVVTDKQVIKTGTTSFEGAQEKSRKWVPISVGFEEQVAFDYRGDTITYFYTYQKQ